MKNILVSDDEDLATRANMEAQRLVRKHSDLTVWPVLARLMHMMYVAAGDASRAQSIAGGEASIIRRHALYAEMYGAVREFMTYDVAPYAALIRIADTSPHIFPSQLGTAFFAIQASPPRDLPLTDVAVLLREHVNALARYLRLVLNRRPELCDPNAPGSYRGFIDEVVQLTGWTATADEITAACTIAMRGGPPAGFKDNHSDLTRAERAAIKAWHAERGFS